MTLEIPAEDLSKEVWTTEATVDQVYFLLIERSKEVIAVNDRTIPVRKYRRQAMRLIKQSLLTGQIDNFVINISDIGPRLKEELAYLKQYPKTLQYVIAKSVERLFEDLDFEYFHLSISKQLKVRFEL